MRDIRILEPRQRPLTAAELHLLRAHLSASRRSLERARSRAIRIGIVLICLLWVLTAAASDVPLWVSGGFWLTAGAVILLWVGHGISGDVKRFDQAVGAGFHAALRRNLAAVYEIRARAFIEFKEVEDEGACYAFELEGEKGVLFIRGQDFYEDNGFPTLDFSLVFPLDDEDRRIDMLIEKRGRKASPQRIVAAKAKLALAMPDNLEIIDCRLEELEQVLAAGRKATA